MARLQPTAVSTVPGEEITAADRWFSTLGAKVNDFVFHRLDDAEKGEKGERTTISSWRGRRMV